MLRYDIINHLISKKNYKRYLEIGVEDGHSIHKVKCDLIHGVDPASKHATFEVPSDEFFKMLDTFSPNTTYDIIFIDGLHVAEQVDRDIINSVNHLSPNGTIVVHDCNPPTPWHARSFEEAKKNGCRQWNGNVWESIAKVRATRPDLDVKVVDTDWGCGIIQKVPVEYQSSNQTRMLQDLPDKLTYEYLNQYRTTILNLISPQQFLDTLVV